MHDARRAKNVVVDGTVTRNVSSTRECDARNRATGSRADAKLALLRKRFPPCAAFEDVKGLATKQNGVV